MSTFAQLWQWPTRQRGQKKARRPALGVEALETRRVLSAAPTPPPIGPTSIQLIQQPSSLSGWSLSGTNWTVENSILTCRSGGPSIFTDQSFSNFNFHAEFSVPAKANSGFYLRSCYEIQVLDSQWRDSSGNPAAANRTTGSMYSLIAPSQQTYVGPNQWNTVDATLVGSTVSVWLNNVLVIDQQVLTRATTGAAYPTYESGPIMIQAYEPNQYSSTVGLRLRNLYVTPLPTPPGTPAALAGTAVDGGVNLTWATPAYDGGSPIADYAIQYSSNGGTTWTTYAHPASTASTATVTGLTNGTSYVFRVAAVNAAGTGPYSVETPRVTPLAAVAGRPTVVAGNGYVDLRWTAPPLTSTPPITDYTIRYSTNGGAGWSIYSHAASAATSLRVLLENGNTYTFQVAPVVSGGIGVYSPISLPVMPFSSSSKPGAPTGVVGIKAGTTVTLTWNSAPGDAGGAVSDYVVQYRLNTPNARWLTYRDLVSPATSANLRLVAGYSYVFQVAAKNRAGVGAYSSQSSPVRV